MRQFLKQIEDKAACLISELVPRAAGKANSVAILGYHRVAENVPGARPNQQPTWNVTPGLLRRQIAKLIDSGFQPISLEQTIQGCIDGTDLGKRFCVTFDDGYANNFTIGAKILKEFDVPATVFLATGFVNSREPFPFDDWKNAGSAGLPAESWQPVDIETCRRALDDGLISIGGHTHRHADFRNNICEFKSDIVRSAEFLQRELGISNPPFAFPFGITALGFVSEEMIEAVQQAGYSCGLNFDNRIADLNDPFKLSRIRVESFDTEKSICSKLDVSYSQVRSWIDSVTSLIRPSRWVKTKTEFTH